VRPDGDCVGSCMGLYLYLKKRFPNVHVDVYLEQIPNEFYMFEVVNVIKHDIQEEKVYDLFIALDCADASRLGFSYGLFEKATTTCCVDHHISNVGYGNENYIVPEASSTAELVYRLIDKEMITKEIAECLYLGIVHDTGVFQYTSTSPETMEAAADLMRKEICASQIIDKTYYEKTYAQNKILGKALLDSQLLLNGKCIASSITRETMEEFGVIPKDLEGIVSQLRVTKDIEVAIFIYELNENEYKVSLRASGDVNVSQVAVTFGGGGHVKAAGLTMTGTIPEIIAQLTAEIEKQL
jgi:phosphoesterase RecJ-like protein